MRFQKWMVAFVMAGALVAQVQDAAGRAKEVLELLVTGRAAELRARATEQVKTALTEEVLQQKVLPSIAALGPVQSTGEAQVEQAGGMTVVVLPVVFEKMALNLRVAYDGEGRMAGMLLQPGAAKTAWSAPAYAKAESLTEREVTVGADEWKLPGTLTLPKGEGPFRAVVLVHGSGPNDRDESVGGVRVFKDLAWGLAAKGVAVLRYEKRTRAHGARMKDVTLNDETVEDAGRAVELLAGLKEIDAKKIYVAGHSLGGYAMPKILARAKGAAGAVILAGSVRPLEDLIEEQTLYLASLQTPSTQVEEGVKQMRETLAKLRALKTGETMEPVAGMPASYLLALRGYRPDEEMKSYQGPVLIVQGERDYQVTMKEFALWKEALSGRANVRLQSYPALNHLLVAGEGKPGPAEYQKPGHVDEKLVADVAAFVRR